MFSKSQWQMIVNALEILSPDTPEGQEEREAILRLARVHAEPFTEREEKAVELARDDHYPDDISLDDDAEVSVTETDGAWVAAWIWVSKYAIDTALDSK